MLEALSHHADLFCLSGKELEVLIACREFAETVFPEAFEVNRGDEQGVEVDVVNDIRDAALRILGAPVVHLFHGLQFLRDAAELLLDFLSELGLNLFDEFCEDVCGQGDLFFSGDLVYELFHCVAVNIESRE